MLPELNSVSMIAKTCAAQPLPITMAKIEVQAVSVRPNAFVIWPQIDSSKMPRPASAQVQRIRLHERFLDGGRLFSCGGEFG